jgi:HD-like signal output (HDOD) protein/prolyl-tRNA editing enzyme YbaK/EbsC (Cys-tRNA(Pro) deacylase)
LQHYLDSHHARYELLERNRERGLEVAAKASGFPFEKVARATILEDEKGLVLAVTHLGALIDINRLNEYMERNFKPLAGSLIDRIFHDCAPGCHPPVGGAYRLEVIVDQSLDEADVLYFEPGSIDAWIKMPKDEFLRVINPSSTFRCSSPIPKSEDVCLQQSNAGGKNKIPKPSITDEEITARLRQVHRLPAMPNIAVSVLKLVNDPDATVEQLSRLIEKDPSIAAQVIRYAQSPYYGYRGKVDSIQTAIVRVLGFELVSHIAISVSLGQQFNLPNTGPIGLANYWKHAVYSATLAQSIASHLDPGHKVLPGLAYLCGLLHNFGILVLGHLFQPEFYLLNKLAATNPGCSIVDIEARLLGLGSGENLMRLGHAYMGGWLMRYWQMPDVLAVVAEKHHQDYQGDHQLYVRIIQVVNIVLARKAISDVAKDDIPVAWLEELGCDASLINGLAERLFENEDALDGMAGCFLRAS